MKSMSPEQVHDEWLAKAMDAGGWSETAEQIERMRISLAAVIPLIEKRLVTGADKERWQQALDFCLGSMGEYGEGSCEYSAYKNCHTFIARLAALDNKACHGCPNCQPETLVQCDVCDRQIPEEQARFDGEVYFCTRCVECFTA